MTPPRPQYRVIQWGTGAVGAEMITAILDHRTDLDPVGVKVYSGAKHGKDVGTLVGRDPVGVLATADIAEVLAMSADCVLPLALSGMSRTIDKITPQERADWSMYESTGITFDNMAFGQPVEQINTTTNDVLAFNSWLFTEQVRYRRCAMPRPASPRRRRCPWFAATPDSATSNRRLADSGTGNPGAMIGRLRSVVVDCKDPKGLAAFYSGVLGGTVDVVDDTWVVLTDPDGRRLAFQYSPQHAPPRFPDPSGSQQFHLDVLVDDVDEAERRVRQLGATRVDEAVGEDRFRVFRDPAGHTFCLVWGVDP